MGCDIHAVVERIDRLSDGDPWGWIDSGDPDIGRNYEMFAALAGVRNGYDITPVAEPKGIPEEFPDEPNSVFGEYFNRWREDAHSASWLTLAEMKAYDTTVTVNDPRRIVGRSDEGKVTAVAGWTSIENCEQVGARRIFVWPGQDESEPTAWDRLIAYMENVRAFHDLKDEEVRLVFFFDN